jgi:DNA-binding CsgD family transcriptional regulator
MQNIDRDAIQAIREAESRTLGTTADIERQAALEAEADALLVGAGIIDIQRGCRTEIYSERQLRWHRRHELSNQEEGILLLATAEAELSTMAARDIERATERAGLTERQLQVWAYHCAGVDQIEIAQMCEISQPSVFNLIRKARRKVALTLMSDPFYGWLRVYWQEVHRG